MSGTSLGSADRDEAASLGVSPVPRLSAPLAAIEQLRALIEDGTLQPGDKLPPERKLAEMLGVSRPTVREALSTLTLLNVIETKHGSGRVVGSLELASLSAPMNVLLSLSFPSGRNVEAVLEMRAAVESGLARLAAMRITDEALEAYGEILGRLQRARTGRDVLQLDMSLHALIAEQSGSPLLAWMLKSFEDLSTLARSRTIKVRGVQEHVADDQVRIYEALKKRDPDAAAEAMWQHLWRIHEAYREQQAPREDL